MPQKKVRYKKRYVEEILSRKSAIQIGNMVVKMIMGMVLELNKEAPNDLTGALMEFIKHSKTLNLKYFIHIQTLYTYLSELINMKFIEKDMSYHSAS